MQGGSIMAGYFEEFGDAAVAMQEDRKTSQEDRKAAIVGMKRQCEEFMADCREEDADRKAGVTQKLVDEIAALRADVADMAARFQKEDADRVAEIAELKAEVADMAARFQKETADRKADMEARFQKENADRKSDAQNLTREADEFVSDLHEQSGKRRASWGKALAAIGRSSRGQVAPAAAVEEPAARAPAKPKKKAAPARAKKKTAGKRRK